MWLKSLFFAFFIVILGADCNFFDFSISMEKAFGAWGSACDVEQLHEALGKWNITECIKIDCIIIQRVSLMEQHERLQSYYSNCKSKPKGKYKREIRIFLSSDQNYLQKFDSEIPGNRIY